MPAAVASSAKALNAILPLVAAGQPYEAHQKARTFASRYSKAQQYDTAIDVLFQSARELLKAGEQGSGTDLAGFLLDVYESKGQQVDAESRSRITQLIALTGSAGSWRKTTIDKALAWSAKHGMCPAGDQDLLLYVGELYYKEGAYDLAEPHLLSSGKRDAARILAEMMTAWATSGGSAGTFALRGTIPYLLNGNVMAAHTFITSYVSLLPPSLRPDSASTSETEGLGIVVTKDSQINFCQLAVKTCQRASGERNKAMREAWVRLCGTYATRGGLLAKPEVRQALNEIGALFFALPPPRTAQANPFGDMLASMFGGPPTASGGAPVRRALAPPAPTLD